MFPFNRIAAFAALMLGAVSLGACAPSVTSQADTAPAIPPGGFDPAGPVKLAILAPLSASNASAASLGQALVNAANLGLQDLNDPLVSIATYDTAGDPVTAAAAAQRAVAEGARIILGPLFSQNASAVAPIATQNSLKVISFSTDSNVAGDPVYLSGFLPEMEARRITSFAAARGLDQIGIFYPQNDAGGLALRGAQTGAGQALTVQTPFERSEAGIPPAAKTFADAVRATGVKAVLIPEAGQALAFIAANLKQSQVTSGRQRFLGLGQWNTPSTIQSKNVQGGWFPGPNPDAVRSFVNRYKSIYGANPPVLAALGYDAVQIAGQLLVDARTTGSNDPFGAAALTRPQGFRAAYGPIRFDSAGLGERGVAILEVGERSFQRIDPAPIAFDLGS